MSLVDPSNQNIPLTPQEAIILRQFMEPKTIEEAAASLNINFYTCRKHVYSLAHRKFLVTLPFRKDRKNIYSAITDRTYEAQGIKFDFNGVQVTPADWVKAQFTNENTFFNTVVKGFAGLIAHLWLRSHKKALDVEYRFDPSPVEAKEALLIIRKQINAWLNFTDLLLLAPIWEDEPQTEQLIGDIPQDLADIAANYFEHWFQQRSK